MRRRLRLSNVRMPVYTGPRKMDAIASPAKQTSYLTERSTAPRGLATSVPGSGIVRVNIDNLSIRAMLKLPTGDVDSLSGSEGTDFTLWMEVMDGELLSTWGTTLSAMNGVVALGEGNPSPLAQKDFAGVARIGLQYALKR